MLYTSYDQVHYVYPIICSYYASDINECSNDNAGCQQVCNNLPGSYSCSCNDGFQLDEDKHNCSGMQLSYS